MPTPVTRTVASSGTIISQPPRIATTWMVTSRSANLASRMSISPPPSSTNAVKFLGTTHSPLREKPPRMANAPLEAALAAEPGRVRHGGPRGNWRLGFAVGGQVVGDRLKLGVGLRRVHRVEALVELVHGQPSVAGGLAQHVGDALPVGVGGAQVAWIWDGGRATHISQA